MDENQTWWSDHLQNELLGSCHFIGVASPTYFEKPWAGGLELNGFNYLSGANPLRKMALVPLGLVRESLPVRLRSFLLTGIPDALEWAENAVDSSQLQLGAPYSPPHCFAPLPLNEMSITHTWGDGENPHDPDPPYYAYERCVRKIMVLIRCGADSTLLASRFARQARWQMRHLEDAVVDATHLLDKGILPW